MAPRGEAEVKAALIEAAAELFSSQGDVSVKAIAARAGVNHGLVHHYFDGKEDLRRATMHHLATAVHAQMEGTPLQMARTALSSTERDPRFLRMLARLLLDRSQEESMQTAFPVVRRLLRALEATEHPRPRETVAEGLALSLGWLLFEPWIRRATGLSKRAVTELREARIRELYEP